MKILKIISTHNRARGKMVDGGHRFIPAVPIPKGMKRVMAITNEGTRHIDVAISAN